MNRTRPARTKKIKQPAPADSAVPVEQRILILAPTGNDARLTANFLAKAGLFPLVCRNVAHLCAEIQKGCGAILLAEETLGADSISQLIQTLAQQPPWSDIPLVLITSTGEASHTRLRRLAMFGPGGNVALLERPFRPGTMISTLEVSLRARQRQYEARNLVEEMGQLLRQQEEERRLFDATLSSITDLAYTFDLQGNWVYANKPLLRLWGKSLEEITGKSSLELGYPPELAERLKRQVQQVATTGKPFKGETYFTDAAGVEDFHEYIFCPVFAADGSVSAVCGTTRLTTERKRAEAVADSQRRVLQLVAEDRPLPQVLEMLAHTIQLQYAGNSCAAFFLIELSGSHLRLAAAPSLPATFSHKMDRIPIGPGSEICGLVAATKKPLFVGDLANDPLGASYRELAEAAGLRSCWSFPILSTRADLLGTLTIYHQEPRLPAEKDLWTMEMATRTAGIAIERKLGDAAIRESRERYSQLVHGLPTAVYTTDAQGRISLFNEAAVALWGRTPEIGKDSWCGSHRLFLPDGTPLPLDQSPLAVTLKEGRSVRGEEIIVERPDGTRRHVLPYPDPIRDASNSIVGAVNMLLDITNTKRSEEDSRRLAAIVESSDDAIISKDLNGIVTSWNHGAEQLFGYRAAEIIGRPIAILAPPELGDDKPDILGRISKGERVHHYETIRRHKSGRLIDVSLTVSPIRDAKGRIIGASKIVRDISRQKQAERRLEMAHQQAVAASHAKDEFLAALSHELRTPLNPALLVASEAAADQELPAEIRDKFTIIRNNVELEARLIDDLLDITRITHGKLSLEPRVVPLDGLLKDSIATVQSELDQKKIRLELKLEAEQPSVKGDAVRLQQVFWNLLKNAIKFTPEAGWICVQTVSPAPGLVAVTVQDSGMGMNESELARLFLAFSQGEHVNTTGSHRFGGLGLGLAISRKLVELHHGTIQATSAGRDQGATFTVTLPLTRERRIQKPKPAFSSPCRTDGVEKLSRILLVDDHEPTRTAIANLLTRRHYTVITAGSVAEAREQALANGFDLIISDIGLPDGTGHELMAELRARHPDLPGIALTGYGMEEDVLRSEQAGFTCHLTKPVRVQALDAALATLHAPVLADT